MATPNITGAGSVSLTLTHNAGIPGAASVVNVQAGSNGTNGAVIPSVSLSYGTGTVLDANGCINVNDTYIWQGAISATSNKSIALNGGSDEDPFGVVLGFVTLRYFLVAVINPDGVNGVQVGPQGVTNGWQGPFGGVGSTVYVATKWRWEWIGPAAGVTVNSTDVFIVRNPGANAVTVQIVLAGVT